MSEVKVYSRPETWMKGVHTHYCPGCGHGIAHRMICEAIDELGIQGDAISMSPVGCAAMMYDYINIDFIEAAHGRAPATATGIKRVLPDKVVFTYQGDGDLASIGMAEIIHAANRGEKICVFFINNAIYGMTGGQMAPTTLIGQKATTCPQGRDAELTGYPIRMCELLTSLETPAYIERVSLAKPYIAKAKKAIKKAFQNQIDRKGFSFVEILSTCPTNWGLSPLDAFDWQMKNMIPYYPLGVFKDFE
ncbi:MULTISPECIES: thiamine pyrophosphate-dependent enzyme [Pyramidobacter]|uniref:Thiamine pyrophosphate enzyme, C-terminal TPP binding domain protein n=2 Tax=Pyramidobacter TaxID=638847 RepID=A0ABM9ZWE3_9BACT|nr:MULTISPECIES: thiamine pyrophosphate-dependent enzyme [Pyramidobacter]EFB91257.1 thiamine pyrophosphate enzyme, C-terminal TPP binding domain protein [Pyramidobacter piscolens W5455]MDY3212555.1 thiamine pyrophosphate-dependent enzyme [Pyramidobacter sp.]MDY4033570.1 thiamine pyrophosphate-dependent enzyme [Pyramidobacter sp.]OON87791.1 2-oxoglutarate oxidoreductase [Pyramidobacter sp. C12-8]RKJ80259.1 2-oxoglutarate oxidoreductase [Pyramidobacter sp. CG50-2]